jgi:hypothetical protein
MRSRFDPAGVVDRLNEQAADDAAKARAIADYYARHPTFASIVRSMRDSFPLRATREIMRAARHAEDLRPKPTPTKEEPESAA